MYHSCSIVRLPLALLSLSLSLLASDKGFCYSAPSVQSLSQTAGAEAAKAAQSIDSPAIRLLVVVSDKGIVCGARVIQTIDPATDADALAAVKGWSFQPAKKDGRPVTVLIIVEVQYERKDGKLVRKTEHPEAWSSVAPDT